ncbi:hypothetical protein BDY19DRAFT_464687 [Irpex rosettiformis]|uniref:Uncharacterized protein n=1 Tax=Irpex rosettiformis TaxID=378272 RepID=A0ACB8TSS2_9APHY|nr:hypothetical protein BDY19DRAFT_464687 [Irpex rosettiformis]
MAYYTRDTSEYHLSRSLGPLMSSVKPGMYSYSRPGSSSRASGSSSSSSSSLPSPPSHSSVSYRRPGSFSRTFEQETMEDKVLGMPYVRQTESSARNALESGKPIDHAGKHPRKMYPWEDPSLHRRVDRAYESTANLPHSSTSPHSARLRYSQPSLSTPPPSSPYDNQQPNWHRDRYSMDIDIDEVGMEGGCEIGKSPMV